MGLIPDPLNWDCIAFHSSDATMRSGYLSAISSSIDTRICRRASELPFSHVPKEVEVFDGDEVDWEVMLELVDKWELDGGGGGIGLEPST
jgi:hypothetical protein